ncbi:MAG: flavodoxin family protein [Methanomassiliicoccales archaeon]
MRTLVAYISETGNTRKVAQAIYDEVPGEKDFMPICDVPDSSVYDLIFMGFPMHQFGPDKKATMRMKQHCVPGRKVALFVTHSAPEDEPELQEWLGKFKECASGAELVGFFDCQGQMSMPVKMVLRLSRDKKMRDWAKIDSSKGQPDEFRIRKAREFAKEVLQKVGQKN